MAKQRAPLEFNSISGGLITEASPLTFPDNASLDEVNFSIDSDGTRSRRLGFELEVNPLNNELNQSYINGMPKITSSFLWENVSGVNLLSLLVIQTDEKLSIFSTDTVNTSQNRIALLDFAGDYKGKVFGFANVDGTLVVATGGKDIISIIANVSTTPITILPVTRDRLTIRDLFGVDVSYDLSVDGGTDTSPFYVDLTDPIYITKRPLLTGLVVQGTGETPTDFTFSNREFYSDSNTSASFYKSVTPNNYLGWELHEFRVQIDTGETYGSIVLHTKSYNPPWEELLYTDYTTGNVYVLRTFGEFGAYVNSNVPSSVISQLIGLESIPFGLSSEASILGSSYIYNLRNQTFGSKRLPKTGGTVEDTVEEFLTLTGRYPAMSDSVISALYPNLEDSGNKTVDRFHSEDLVSNPVGSFPAPKGYFIIDALDRSLSREERWNELVFDQNYEEGEVVALDKDETPGGATVVTEYGGRLWYGGFSEEGSVGAGTGTLLSSYLLFSQLATSRNVLTRCYQVGDPTSLESPELLDTDGGFISLDGAYGIKKLVNIGTALIVLAENGVWAITGNDGNYFTPTAPRVTKINDKGCVSANSVVVVDSSIIYWARDGIYLLDIGELGQYKQDNLTESTIQTLYSEISFTDKELVSGAYDPYRNAVDWAIYNTVDRVNATEILTLKTDTGAFTKSVLSDSTIPQTLVGYATLPPFILGEVLGFVTDGGIVVTDAGVDVTVTSLAPEPSLVTTKGIVISSVSDVSYLTFGGLTNQDFLDWDEVDAPGYIITGYVSGGDLQRYKQVPYVTCHFNRTEDGFELDGEDIVPSHPSGCLMQVQWDWANSVNSGRWGREFQAYRYRRHYMPTDVNDPYDYGFETIITKNKIRGKGRVLSFKFATEAGKDCRILGWSGIMGVNSNV